MAAAIELDECPIGSLLLNGEEYPIFYGPNRIGREPNLCEIYLDFPSVSRLHSIINASSTNNIVIMDLGSFNKTKLDGKILKPNMPYSLKNCSVVHFGAMLGVFRLCEDECDEIPMTQAMEIPETPVPSRHVAKIKNMQTIPESPDTSGMESFIGQSHTSSTIYMDLNESEVSISNISTHKTNKCVKTNENICDKPTKSGFQCNKTIVQSIHNANTQQLADQSHIVPSVFEMDTQDPAEFQFKLPDAQNISKQKDVIDVSTNNDNVNKSVYEVVTQYFDDENLELTKCQPARFERSNKSYIYDTQKKKTSMSIVHNITCNDHELNNEIDIDDIELMPSQKLPVTIEDDDVTDCEDECDIPVNSSMKTRNNFREEKNKSPEKDEMIDIDFHDLPTQIIENDVYKEKNTNFEDLPTQVIDGNILNKNMNPVGLDVLTKNVNFKVPFTVENNKKTLKSPSKANLSNKLCKSKHSNLESNDNNYYSSTQEILVDLCSQNSALDEANRSLNKSKLYTDFSEELVPDPLSKQSKNKNVLHPAENCEISKQIRPTVSSTNIGYIPNAYYTSLQEFSNTNKESKTKIDSSDPEVTPTKTNPKQFITVELPDSQEIKALVNSKRKHVTTYETSESETDENSEDQYTPILHRKKKRPRKDLDVVFPNVNMNTECLPLRILTRNRKPSQKILEADDKTRRSNKVILKPKLYPDENIAKEIIIENIARLKNTSSNNGIKQYETEGTDVSQKSLRRTRTTTLKNYYIKDEKKQSENNCNNYNNKRTETSKKKSTDKNNTVNKTTTTVEIKVKSIEPPYKSLGTKSKTNETKDTDVIKNDNKTTKSLGTKSKINENKDTDAIKKDNKTTKSRSKRNENKDTDVIKKDNKSTKSLGSKSKTNDNKDIDATKKDNKTTKSLEPKSKKNDNDNKDAIKKDNKSTKSLGPKSKKDDNKDIDAIRKDNKTTKSLGSRSKTNENKDKDAFKNDNETTKSLGTRSKTNENMGIDAIKNDATSFNIVNRHIEETSTNKKKQEENKEKKFEQSKRMKYSESVTDLRMGQPRKVKHNLLICMQYTTQISELKRLAVNIVTDIKNCSILLIKEFRRTFKILCAISLGIPIVGPSWVQSCLENNTIVDPWMHLFRDEAKEKFFKFNLKETLRGKRNFLKGYQVSSTPSVVPGPEELKMIVECSGGVWVGAGVGAAGRWVVASCREDAALWPRCQLRGATVVSNEALLIGVLRQRLDPQLCRLTS